MKEVPQISNAEWQVMKIIWDKAPIKSLDVIKFLETSTDWKPKTIKTLIRRLLDKGVINYKEVGNTYIYDVVIPEKSYVEKETNNFLNKIYNGSLSHMMLNFIKHKKITNDEISELIKILEDNKEN